MSAPVWPTTGPLRAEATVVRLVKKQEPDKKPIYHPEFRFTASDGKAYTVESGMGSSSPDYVVGQKLSVVYDPDDPSKAVIESFWEIWVSPIALILLGLILVHVGLFGRSVRRKRA